jgi:hypothetical protein
MDLVCVHVQEPVPGQFRLQLLLPPQDRPGAEHTVTGKPLDPEQAPAKVTPRNGAVVVQQVHLRILLEEVFQAVSNEALLVENGQQGNYSHVAPLKSPIQLATKAGVCSRPLIRGPAKAATIHHQVCARVRVELFPEREGLFPDRPGLRGGKQSLPSADAMGVGAPGKVWLFARAERSLP